MLKKLLKYAILLMGILSLGIGTQSVHANENLSVSVKAILPDNQHNKEVSYYDLRMQPGQKEDLDLELFNSSDQDQTVQLQINNASTNSTGAIDYSDRGGHFENDSSMKKGFSLKEIVQVDEEVKIPAKSQKIVKLYVQMPPEKFDGMILGAVRVTTPDSDEKNKEKDQAAGMQIKNKIAYSISILLTETDNPVPAELKLIKTFPSQQAGRNVVRAKIQNSQANVLEKIDYSAQIYKKGSKDILHQAKASNYRFAPNSNFDFLISWEGQRFQPGQYQIHMTGESKDTGQKWAWDDEFSITRQESKKLNKKAIDVDKDYTWLYLLLGLLLLILLVLLLILYLYLKNKKKSKKRSKRNKKGNKKK